MKETKKTIVSVGEGELPVNPESNVTEFDVLDELQNNQADGITQPDLDNFEVDANMLAIQMPSVSTKTAGGIIKSDATIAKEKEDYSRFPALLVAVGENTMKQGYKVGDYVYLDRFTKDGATQLIINRNFIIVCNASHLVGRSGNPKKMASILTKIAQRNKEQEEKLESLRSPKYPLSEN